MILRNAPFTLTIAQNSAKSGLFIALVMLCASAFFTLAPTPARAQADNTPSYDGSKSRINRSAYLRALSEAIACASCRLNAGIDPDTARAELSEAHDKFDAILTGLEYGSDILGMPKPETNPRTRSIIQDTAAIWAPVDAAAQSLLGDTKSDRDAAVIHAAYPALFDQTVVLAADVSGVYSNPRYLLQSDATVVNYAVRQRALAHRMARMICEIATGTGTDDTVTELAATVDLFDRTLVALRDGLPDAGVTPPPNDHVRDTLIKTYDIWRQNRQIFDIATTADTLPRAADVSTAAALAKELSLGMNNAITLYLIAAPGQETAYRVPLLAYVEQELSGWINAPTLIEMIRDQNRRHENLDHETIMMIDEHWSFEISEGGGPMIESFLQTPASLWLLEQQKATAGFVTEVIVMDNRGVIVAQSIGAYDFWQGEEDKWLKTYAMGPDAVHISPVAYEQSTGYYQAQASISIADPDTGDAIGAITFGINIQNLM